MWEKVLITGLIGLGIRSVRKDAEKAAEERQREETYQRRKEEERRQQEEKEKRRHNTPCFFNNGITQEEFYDIVQSSRKHIKRLVSLTSEGPIVYGAIRSQSGISVWEFTLDFNDFGQITGSYWKSSENYDSDIPQYIADNIQGAIQDLLEQRGISVQCDAETESSMACSVEEEIPVTSELKQTQPNLESKGRWKKTVLLILVVLSIGVITFFTWKTNRQVVVGASSNSLQGEDYTTVWAQLEHSGFTNIHLNELYDLLSHESEKEGLVASVTINGNPSFSQTDKYRCNSEIIISYHVMKHASPPLSAKAFKGMHYETAIELLLAAGFSNVQAIPDYDLLLGWISKEGAIKSIAINGNEKFTTDNVYRLDEEIAITFHAFKRDNP